jgi:hypothetical protein
MLQNDINQIADVKRKLAIAKNCVEDLDDWSGAAIREGIKLIDKLYNMILEYEHELGIFE